ncbi:MAG TPA: SMI1/KNR4 family protein [Spirochaetota bacterium]
MSANKTRWSDLVDEDIDYFTGPPLTDEMIDHAQKKLGYKLPDAYIDLLRYKNGCSFIRNCFPTDVPTNWSETHFVIEGISGIGGEDGIDSDTGSDYMIKEWGYPPVGIAFGQCPSAGHETVMFDYSECGKDGEPAVIYVDMESDTLRKGLRIADNFESFLSQLTDESDYPDEE